uniref:Uncharacterized protein n=1 Tax=Strigamia maritima TaxID=126957 RepID=T1IJ84_STRMM
MLGRIIEIPCKERKINTYFHIMSKTKILHVEIENVRVRFNRLASKQQLPSTDLCPVHLDDHWPHHFRQTSKGHYSDNVQKKAESHYSFFSTFSILFALKNCYLRGIRCFYIV